MNFDKESIPEDLFCVCVGGGGEEGGGGEGGFRVPTKKNNKIQKLFAYFLCSCSI